MTEEIEIADRKATVSATPGHYAFGGYIPGDDVENPWPPKDARPPLSFLNVFKMIEAKLRGGKLVWLRDVDECQTLAVAVKDGDGKLKAARWWPSFRMCQLNDDGSVGFERQYVRHWIIAEEKDKIFMMIDNGETYARPLIDR